MVSYKGIGFQYSMFRNSNVAICSNKQVAMFLWKSGCLYGNIDRSKDKNTTQGNLAELVGSPVAPFRCK